MKKIYGIIFAILYSLQNFAMQSTEKTLAENSTAQLVELNAQLYLLCDIAAQDRKTKEEEENKWFEAHGFTAKERAKIRENRDRANRNRAIEMCKEFDVDLDNPLLLDSLRTPESIAKHPDVSIKKTIISQEEANTIERLQSQQNSSRSSFKKPHR